MKRVPFIVLLIVVLSWVHGCSGDSPSTEDRPKIAATIFPLHDIAGNIVGDNMEVVGILPPGASPHTYAPSPRQIGELGGVRIVFSIGHGLDDWTDNLIDMLPNAKKVVVDEGIHLVEPTELEEHEEPGHNHEGANPHYWLSIRNAKQIARTIAEEVIRIDSAGEDVYRKNLETYLSELDSARKRIEEQIGGLSVRKMMTFHDAWVYYADEFGLEIVGAFEPFPGKQPTPRYLAELHERAKEHNLKALFSEPQLSSETVSSFVSDIDLDLYVLDPLGGGKGRGSYIELLDYNTRVIVEALRNGKE